MTEAEREEFIMSLCDWATSVDEESLIGERFYWQDSEHDSPVSACTVVGVPKTYVPGLFACALVKLDGSSRKCIAKYEDLKCGSEIGMPRLEPHD